MYGAMFMSLWLCINGVILLWVTDSHFCMVHVWLCHYVTWK